MSSEKQQGQPKTTAINDSMKGIGQLKPQPTPKTDNNQSKKNG